MKEQAEKSQIGEESKSNPKRSIEPKKGGNQKDKSKCYIAIYTNMAMCEIDI